MCILVFISSFFLKDVPVHESYAYEDNKINVHSWHDAYETVTGIILAAGMLVIATETITGIIRKVRFKEKTGKMILCAWAFGIAGFLIVCFSDILITGIRTKEDYNPVCYEFTDGNNTIVIEEVSFLLYGGGTIYQVKDDSTAVIIGKIRTDDGGRNKGSYDIKWYDDCAEITYDTFALKESKITETVKFQ